MQTFEIGDKVKCPTDVWAWTKDDKSVILAEDTTATVTKLGLNRGSVVVKVDGRGGRELIVWTTDVVPA